MRGKVIEFDPERNAMISDDRGTLELKPRGIAGILYCPEADQKDLMLRLLEKEPLLSEPGKNVAGRGRKSETVEK